jgi:hypothetical protein
VVHGHALAVVTRTISNGILDFDFEAVGQWTQKRLVRMPICGKSIGEQKM